MRYPYPLRIVLVALGLCAIASVVRADEAQNACADRALVVKRLADRYGETLRSMGLHENDGVVEVYSSDETGTWTILISRPDGKSCMLAAGQMWEQDAAPTEPPGEDS